MAEDQTRVEIGFGIGQVLSVKLAEGELAELRKQVETGKGWFDMRTQEGTDGSSPRSGWQSSPAPCGGARTRPPARTGSASGSRPRTR